MLSDLDQGLLIQRPEPDSWVSVSDEETGEGLGYITFAEAEASGMVVYETEPTTRYLRDPYLIYHARMLREQGHLAGNLNSVQRALLAGVLVRDQERGESEQEASFFRDLFIADEGRFQRAMAAKKARAFADAQKNRVVSRAPISLSELAEDLGLWEDSDDMREIEIPAGMSTEEAISRDLLSEMRD
jgi:hypothetical protein